MKYRVEVLDRNGLRLAQFSEVPLLETRIGSLDVGDTIRGLLPESIASLSNGCRVNVYLEEALVCSAVIFRVAPQWGDTKKLILDRYVSFHEVVEFEARRNVLASSGRVSQAYTNREVSAIVRDLINRAPSPLHYLVRHSAYPDAAVWEYRKFNARRNELNELELGGINAGQWVGSDRIDASNAYARDGDTISGLVVDGVPWPDLRLMMIDCEESSLNSHALSQHPEIAAWSDAQYDNSPYKRRADAATQALAALLVPGISYIELNPHRNAAGAFDDRVDAYGRYLGLVYGGGKCFNAALVEQGLADVYLYANGAYLAPELALKDYYSYGSVQDDSVDYSGVVIAQLDAQGGVLEVIAALCYAAGGYGLSVDQNLGVSFRKSDIPKRVFHYAPKSMNVQWATDARQIMNLLWFSGNPLGVSFDRAYSRGESIDAYGLASREWAYFSLTHESDATRVAEALLDDLAYPSPDGMVLFHRGVTGLAPGDLIELRNPPLRHLDAVSANAWGGRFGDRFVARVREVRHRLSGKEVSTTLLLTSPLRSVAEPLAFITRSQGTAESLFAFRLDATAVGLDMGFHLD